MKKPILLSLVLCACSLALFAQTYPANFHWGPPASTLQKENQVVQNPCSDFATVAGMECWYDILYSTNNNASQMVSLSQQPGYSWCGTGNLAPNPQSTTIQGTLQILQTTGTVNTDSATDGIKWGQLGVCNTDNPKGMTPYFGQNMGVHPVGQNLTYSCANPFGAGTVYYISTYQKVILPNLYPSLSTIQKLQREILNYGPVIINMTTKPGRYNLHCGNTHAYLIFGWTTSGSTVTWLLRDSWPAIDSTCANDPGAVTDFSEDLIAGINADSITVNINDTAFVLSPTITNGAISQEAVYTSGTQPTITPVPVTESGNNLFSVNFTLPDNYLSGKSPITATLTGTGFGQLDPGYKVSWKSVPAHPGATANVTFGSPNSDTTTVLAGVEGYASFEAVITLPNGIQESVPCPLDSFYVCGGIPITIQQNYDFCSGTTRTVQYQMVSRSKQLLPHNLEISWNLQPVNPEPSIYYQTSDFPDDIITLDWYDLTHGVGYALRPTVTDPNYNNITDGDTQPGNESPCAGGGSVARPLEHGQGSFDSSQVATGATAIRIFPNPANDHVNVSLPAGKQYLVRLLNGYGSEVLERYATGDVSLNLGGRARGIYFIEIIPTDPGEALFTQVLILK
jgi:hypothetical protein